MNLFDAYMIFHMFFIKLYNVSNMLRNLVSITIKQREAHTH